MRVLTVLQARTGSSRLPGKILLPLGERTVLEVMLERVRRSRLAGTVCVATTTDPDDDALVALAERAGAATFRGHPTDLLDRHVQAARAFGADAVVKIPSDCPLIDPAEIDAVLAPFLAAGGALAYASNLHPPTHPDGNDVEVMTTAALEAAWREATDPDDREHTTPYLVRHADRFPQRNVPWARGLDLSASHRIVLDYPEDYALLRAVHAALAPADPAYTLDDIVQFLDTHPEVRALNASRLGIHWWTLAGKPAPSAETAA
ncbi:MAG: glycosyltransferase family protein [Gemmatimonadales bacterium]|nr:glycosyltransferase family protein [Gemmatimonadales bacterium]